MTINTLYLQGFFLSVSLRTLKITKINRELLKFFLNSETSQLSRDLTAGRSLHEKRMTSADQWMKNGWLKQNEVKFSVVSEKLIESPNEEERTDGRVSSL